MITLITAIAAAWFGVLSAYFYSAKHLKVRNSIAKAFIKNPLVLFSISMMFGGFYIAFLSDSLILQAFQYLAIDNIGIGDYKIQGVSLIFTAIVAVPIALSYRWITSLVEYIGDDKEDEKYFTIAGFSMVVVSATFATASALFSMNF